MTSLCANPDTCGVACGGGGDDGASDGSAATDAADAALVAGVDLDDPAAVNAAARALCRAAAAREHAAHGLLLPGRPNDPLRGGWSAGVYAAMERDRSPAVAA